MNKGISYYEVACNDYRYFTNYLIIINDEYNNPLAIQAQQIVEKLLKHIVDVYCLEYDQKEVLRSHKLQSIYTTIRESYPEFVLKRDDLLFLSSFYFDARYPGVDYIVVDREDANRCISIVNEVKQSVDAFIKEQDAKVK